MSDFNQTISQVIAGELNVKPQQILAAMNLLDEGNTIPFIARYRKEVTGGLDDTQLRHFETRLIYLRELDDRRQTILKSIDEQGKLNDELREKILATESKTELEDLYLPYKPKRRTRGQIAIEAGLEPLAEQLWQNPKLTPEAVAEQFISVDKGVTDSKAALDGARYSAIIFLIASHSKMCLRTEHWQCFVGVMRACYHFPLMLIHLQKKGQNRANAKKLFESIWG